MGSRLSYRGPNSAGIDVKFWKDSKGLIHLIIDGMHVRVSHDPARTTGHPALYRKLAGLLVGG